MIVLITGCSSGIGLHLVPAFLERGWSVIATMRNAAERGDTFRDLAARYPEALLIADLDLTSAAQRQAAADLVDQRFGGRLDALVNNAGSGLFGALEDLSEQQLRQQMEVNFFGLCLLTRTLLPSLRRAGGRIICLSSMLGWMGMPLTSAYCASKFAVEGLAESLSHELAPHGVQVALVQPGAHRTGFLAKLGWGETSFSPGSPYRGATLRYRELRESSDRRGRGGSPESVGRIVVQLAERRRMPLRVRCGADAKLAWTLRSFLPERLWWSATRRLNRRLLETEGLPENP